MCYTDLLHIFVTLVCYMNYLLHFFRVLVGDCTGAAFEMEGAIDAGTKLVLKKYLTKLEGPFFKGNLHLLLIHSIVTFFIFKLPSKYTLTILP